MEGEFGGGIALQFLSDETVVIPGLSTSCLGLTVVILHGFKAGPLVSGQQVGFMALQEAQQCSVGGWQDAWLGGINCALAFVISIPGSPLARLDAHSQHLSVRVAMDVLTWPQYRTVLQSLHLTRFRIGSWPANVD